MKVVDFITEIDINMNNNVNDTKKVSWFKELETNLYKEIVKEFRVDLIDVAALQETYSLEGKPYKFEDIEQLKINQTEYKLSDVFNNSSRTFFKKNGLLALNPIPVMNIQNGIEIIYRYYPAEKTVDTMNTDTLTLLDDFGDEYKDVYTYYFYRKIAVEQKQFVDANNYGLLYNDALGTFAKWYNSVIPRSTMSRWR